MPRRRQYIETDVYTEAKKRLHHIYDIFDSVVVCFSGGKDSLATLNLTYEVAQERGEKIVNVVFRDEELIPNVVIDFVDSYRQKDWVKMLYFAVPLRSKKFVLGKVTEYVQWDPNRRHVRPVPEHAITLPAGDTRVFDQYTMDSFTATYFKGKVALVTGIRSSESLIRFRACVNKLNENYINTPVKYSPEVKVPANVKLCKPLFDWEEDDVFKYFYDKDIPYCKLYDSQLWAGQGLRVSTPLHAESAKRFDKLKEIDPTLYQQVIEIFPEMRVHERYWGELDLEKIRTTYSESLDGIRDYIDENITDEHEHELAMRRFESAAKRHRTMPDAYPLRYMLNCFMSGSYKREILPQRSPVA